MNVDKPNFNIYLLMELIFKNQEIVFTFDADFDHYCHFVVVRDLLDFIVYTFSHALSFVALPFIVWVKKQSILIAES